MMAGPHPPSWNRVTMTTEWKAAANRKNAMKSSGPKSMEGKNIARRNALKHGLTAETPVVLGEDAQAFQCMADEHLQAFRPKNRIELEMARTFTVAAWRRLRCVSTETSLVNQYIRDTARTEKVGEAQDVLALGERLFYDNQDLSQLFPDPAAKHWPRFKRKD